MKGKKTNLMNWDYEYDEFLEYQEAVKQGIKIRKAFKRFAESSGNTKKKVSDSGTFARRV